MTSARIASPSSSSSVVAVRGRRPPSSTRRRVRAHSRARRRAVIARAVVVGGVGVAASARSDVRGVGTRARDASPRGRARAGDRARDRARRARVRGDDRARAKTLRARATNADGSSVEATFAQAYEGGVTYARVRVAAARSSTSDDFPTHVTVHERGRGANGGCDAATLGEVYNPDGGARGACAGGTCAIGDVCARMDAGMIASVGGKTYEFVDRNLPLAGRRSVSGRALAVWRGDRAAGLNGFSAGKVPFACATIEEDDDEDGFVEARATLGTTLSKISGLVTLRQSAADAAADTRISVQLVNRAQGDAIGPYRWAIYSGSAGSSNSCAHVGSLYNPEEKSSCASRGVEALAEDCPIGEIWVRQGTLSSSEIVLFSDSNLPLSGAKSIVGKTFVLLDGNGAEVLCSDVVLASKTGRSLAMPKVSIGAQVGLVTVLLIVSVLVLRYYGNLPSSCSFKRRSSRGDFSRLSEEFRGTRVHERSVGVFP